MTKRMIARLGARIRATTPSFLQIAALALIVAGFWVIALPAGLIAAGIALGVIGWAVDE